jgi:hypothetical protein
VADGVETCRHHLRKPNFLYKNKQRIFKPVEINHCKKGMKVGKRKIEGMNQLGV